MHHPRKFDEGKLINNLDTRPAPQTFTTSRRQRYNISSSQPRVSELKKFWLNVNCHLPQWDLHKSFAMLWYACDMIKYDN